MDDDGNLKSEGEDGDYSDPDAIPKSDSDDPDADPKSDDDEYAGDEEFKPKSSWKLEGLKKFKCDLCEQLPFDYKIELVNHKKSDHGIIPAVSEVRKGTHQCDLCSKSPYTTIG